MMSWAVYVVRLWSSVRVMSCRRVVSCCRALCRAWRYWLRSGGVSVVMTTDCLVVSHSLG